MIVTISNQYGCGARDIAERAAAELGYAVIDRELPVVVARRMRISDAQAQAADETGRSLRSRLLTSLELATPDVAVTNFGQTFDDDYVREVQEAVREFAARDNVVIMGRAAGAILGRRPDLVRVYLYAPLQWRIDRAAERLGDRKTAQSEVERVDRARRAHLRDWYRVEQGSPEIVDLAIDTSSFSAQSCAELIVTAVRAQR